MQGFTVITVLHCCCAAASGAIEFSDFTLMSVLQKLFQPFDIDFVCGSLSPEKQQFFEEVLLCAKDKQIFTHKIESPTSQ